MTHKTKFKLESRKGIVIEEEEIEFRIYNYSQKEKQILITIERRGDT